MRSLTFAIDFDDTFTACPELWCKFVAKSRKMGHRFVMVTARRETEENVDTINSLLDHWECQMPIVFTSLCSKIEAVRSRAIEVDIWIDDDPETLVRGH